LETKLNLSFDFVLSGELCFTKPMGRRSALEREEGKEEERRLSSREKGEKTDLWIVDEGSSFSVGREFSRRTVLETFDDGLERSKEGRKGE